MGEEVTVSAHAQGQQCQGADADAEYPIPTRLGISVVAVSIGHRGLPAGWFRGVHNLCLVIQTPL